MASSDQDKRLRAELAHGLGYFPASLGAEDVARYREQIAQRKAREDAGERDGWGPGGYKWRQWDHLREEKRRAELEARGRAEVADLYERAVITTRIDPMLWKPEQAAYSQPTFRNLLWENKIRKRTRRPIERRNIIC